MSSFQFDLGARVTIDCSQERGTVVAAAKYQHGEDQYLVRYTAADGRAVEQWWGESALTN